MTKDVWIFEEYGKRNPIMYCQESIRHPAKMHLPMCRKIIKMYTKKGDLILDPMTGIGTVICEAMILGRNAIGVEYEQKFVDLAKKNIEKTSKNCDYFKSLGKGEVIKGDSRKLSELLNKQVDSLLFSPPFVNQKQGCGINTRMQKGIKTEKDNYGATNQGQAVSDDKNNIDNMKNYGKIDSIITSPPYEEGIGHGGGRKNPGVNRDKGIWTQGKGSYSKDKNNVGEMRGKNYLTEMLKIYVQCFLILKKGGYMILVVKNFVRKGVQVRLDLDTIKLCEKAGFKYVRRHYRKIKNPSFWITNAIQKWEKKHPKPHPYPLEEDILVFSKDNSQIDNGKINSVIFSPPFADINKQNRDKPDSTADKLGREHIGKKYSKDKENIGNMKYPKIDVVMMSPPYAHESTRTRRDGESTKKTLEIAKSGHLKETIYSMDPDNIGNLKY